MGENICQLYIWKKRGVNWCSHYKKQHGTSSKKKLKIELPYNPAITLLVIYSNK